MSVTELDRGFARALSVELTIPMKARVAVVWKALVKETTKWWPKEFYTSKKTRAFVIEPKLGGRMFEKQSGGSGLVWMTVYGIEPPKYLYLVGFISPPFGGPATTLLTLRLEEKGKSKTVLKLQDNCFGQISNKMAQSLDDGWKYLFDSHLRPYVEKKKR